MMRPDDVNMWTKKVKITKKGVVTNCDCVKKIRKVDLGQKFQASWPEDAEENRRKTVRSQAPGAWNLDWLLKFEMILRRNVLNYRSTWIQQVHSGLPRLEHMFAVQKLVDDAQEWPLFVKPQAWQHEFGSSMAYTTFFLPSLCQDTDQIPGCCPRLEFFWLFYQFRLMDCPVLVGPRAITT